MDATTPFIRRLLPALALAAAAPPALGADIDLLSLSIEELADMRVTSVSRVEERLADAPAAVFVITREELRSAGVTTLAEALRLAPGVEVARRNSHGWSITLRGFNSDLANKLLVLIDGRSIYSPLYAGVFWDVQDTLLEDIDRIEVIAGPGGALWGANAVNGVINIITRSAADTTGAFVEAGAGNEEQGFAAFRYGGAVGDVAARGYVKAWDRDSLKNADGSDGVDQSRMAQGGFRLDWNAADADRLTVQGDFYEGDEAGVFDGTFTLGTLPATSSIDKTDLSGANVLMRWDRALGDGANFSLQSYYDRTDRDIPNTYAEVRDTFDVDFQHRLRPAGRHDVLWGGGFRSTSDEIANTLYATFDPAERRDETTSAFLQDRIAVNGDRMFLTLGSKFEHNDYTGFETQPSARFSWVIDDRRSFWSAISKAVRIPARLDSDLRLMVPVGLVVGIPAYVSADGNTEYGSEELVAYEAGYRFRPTERLSLDVSVYRHDYDDLQTVEPLAPVIVLTPPFHAILPHRIENLLTGTSTGGTFVANWQATDQWRLRFQYSRLDLDFERKPGSADTSRYNERGNSPENQVGVYSFVELSNALELYTGARYVDELPNQGVDSYLAFNAGLTWSPMATLSTSLSIENLNDARHLEFGGESKQIERSAFFRVRWTF